MAEPGSASDFVAAMADEYHALRSLAERAAAQVDDARFFATLDGEANSIAALMKHIGGNLNSRWRDFRTTDGEKPDRHRDAEFEPGASRDAVVAVWARGWGTLESALGTLAPADLAGHVLIRGERVALPRALARNLSHVAGHVHQLVMLAKHWAGPSWKTLSIPRGMSEQARLGDISGASGPRA
jgi:Protein of unknown function (DUF1572)